LRAALLQDGTAHLATLSPADLLRAEAIYVGNSLRGLMAATLLSPDPV
jgi:branched-subunit amino acid aminotransferase/4-amino-4-deoxychorismate lyase